MNDHINLDQGVKVQLVRRSKMKPIGSQLVPTGFFDVECYGADGKLKWEEHIPNGITNVGKNLLLDTMFAAGSQSDPWSISLIQDGGYSALSAGDTMSSHAGWQEFTGYDETIRVEWDEAAAASQQITSSTTSDFSINTADTLKGIFVVDDNTKGGTSGTLWATGLFSSDQAVINGDTLKITYTVTS